MLLRSIQTHPHSISFASLGPGFDKIFWSAINLLGTFILYMDLSEGFQGQLVDFFQESRLNGLALPIEGGKFDDEEQIFRFEHNGNARDFVPHQELPQQHNHEEYMQLVGYTTQNRPQNMEISFGDGFKGQIDGLLDKQQDEPCEEDGHNAMPLLVLSPCDAMGKSQERQTEQQHNIDTAVLQSLITFLVECPATNPLQLHEAVQAAFPQLYRLSVVQVLLQKFSKLRKTKQQLIKYCMRKAFKFILELPSNSHLFPSNTVSPTLSPSGKKQRVSFSRCRNKYLNRISEEKSMNSKFLQQVFSQGDFKRDYFIFLSQLEQIILDDNTRKIAYLAQLLSGKKEKGKTAEMVRRLPWTNNILNKVRAVAKELLKYAHGGQE